MVVIAIVGLLLGLAVNSYNDQVVKTRRGDGKVALTDIAQRLEQCFPDANTYVGCIAVSPEASPEGHYMVAIVTTVSTYTLTAAPQGPQAYDLLCASLTLNDRGTKAATGTATDRCW